jgi:hypothetical protein
MLPQLTALKVIRRLANSLFKGHIHSENRADGFRLRQASGYVAVEGLTPGKEAILYRRLPAGRVKCTACARYCNIGEGQMGFCGIRGNLGGKLQLYVYGKIIAGHIDPIEKKPVTHYMP